MPLALALAAPARAQQAVPAEAMRTFEERRVAIMDKCAPAVCGVMATRAPGGGSGVIIDPAGHALTNFHCVQEEKRQIMKIGLPDGYVYVADVLGIDPGGDVALLRLRPREPGQKFPFVPLGDSDQLKPGEVSFAMGNPFLLATDFKPTVTLGIVSGVHRYQPGQGNRFLVYPDCIQVDTPINPGNSGGPLFNERGELVGINGRISVGERGRVNVGVGFAISINQIKNFLPDLRAGRHCEHGTLDMNAWLMTDPNTRGRQGVFAQGMLEDSVAVKAGIALQDEILAFNDVHITSANQLASLVGVLPAGFEVFVTFRRFDEGVQRYGEPRTVRIALAAMDTGTAKADKERIAADSFRAWERDRVLARFLATGPRAAPVAVAWKLTRRDLASGKSAPLLIARRGDDLRVESEGQVALLKDGKAFDFELGKWKEADDNWVRHLTRLRDLHPLLVGADLPQILKDSLMDGGYFVEARLASVLALPEEGKRAMFFDEQSGLVTGSRFRSDVVKEVMEFRIVVRDGKHEMLRVRVAGKEAFEDSIHSEVPVDPAWFEVPAR